MNLLPTNYFQMRNVLTIFFSLLFVYNLSSQSSGTKGTEFWLAYMENLDLVFNGDPEFTIYISADEAGSATITAPFTGLTFEFEYDENAVTSYSLPPGIFYAQGSETIANFGLRINTTTEVNVHAVHYRIYFCASTMVLPTSVLSDEYMISAGKDEKNSASSPSSFVIVATEDNTEIEITPSAITAGLRPANIPFTITLDAGNSYQIQAADDLTGSKVVALNGSKLAVFAGAKQAFILCEVSADNHLYDQVYPVDYADDFYALIPFKNQGVSKFKILALENDTEIYVDGNILTTLQSGEFIEEVYDAPHLISSSNKIFVTQFNPSQLCTESQIGDPTMLNLSSANYRINSISFENLTGFEISPQAFSGNYMTLFTETENAVDILLDGIDISNLFIDFPGNTAYRYATIDLSPGTSQLTAPEGVYGYVYGFGDFDAYAHSLGFNPKTEVSTKEIDPISMSIYPNPCTDLLYINSKNIVHKINLITIDGKILRSIKVNKKSTTLNVSELPPGIYLLCVKTNNKNNIQKIIKQ